MMLQRKNRLLKRKASTLYSAPFVFNNLIIPALFCQSYFPWIKSVSSFDVETTGLNPYQDGGTQIFAYSTFDSNIPIVQRLDGNSSKCGHKRLQDFLDDYTIAKTCHNVKFEISQLKTNGFHIPEKTVWHDTMLMSQILDNLCVSHALDYLAWKLCGWTRKLDKRVRELGKIYGCYSLIPENLMNEYQEADAMRGLLLYDTFAPVIVKDKLLTEVYLYEVELAKETQSMEQYGMLLHRDGALKLIDELSVEIDLMQKETYDLFGEFINPNSEDQVRRILYDRLGYPVIALSKESKKPKVDKFTIFELQEEYNADHPFLNLIIKYRTYFTARSNIRKYIELSTSNGIIHCSIKTNHDKTGREASEKPNLQNIAKNIITPTNPFPVAARKCYRARPGYFMDLVDYSGIELRLIIALCKEPELMEAVLNNLDVHSMVCNYWYHDVYIDGRIIRFSELDKNDPLRKALRGIGKNANFALGYGASIKRLAKALGISIEETKRNLALIQERWPLYAFFTKNMLHVLKKKGYVKTPFGRKLKVPLDKLFSGSNYLVQGTAAEILKRAQVRVSRYYRENWGEDIHIQVPVHDEIIQEKNRRMLQYDSIILPQVRLIMIDYPEILLPLDVEYKRSFTTWNEAREINLKGEFI